MLVAPLFENVTKRDVYLPQGNWIDYQTGKIYSGGWHNIEEGKIPIVALVREGSVIPHIALAQSTSQMDWSKIDLVVYTIASGKASGLVCLPTDKVLHTVTLVKSGNGYKIENDPFAGKVKWNIKKFD